MADVSDLRNSEAARQVAEAAKAMEQGRMPTIESSEVFQLNALFPNEPITETFELQAESVPRNNALQPIPPEKVREIVPVVQDAKQCMTWQEHYDAWRTRPVLYFEEGLNNHDWFLQQRKPGDERELAKKIATCEECCADKLKLESMKQNPYTRQEADEIQQYLSADTGAREKLVDRWRAAIHARSEAIYKRTGVREDMDK